MNPILVEVTRGDLIESHHRGAYCVVDYQGNIIDKSGDIDNPIYPRSSIKVIQAISLLESGAADKFNITEQEISLACSSHNGEEIHINTALSMLKKAGLDDNDLQCGSHWPMNEQATVDLATSGQKPGMVHNNCSGKHSGFLVYMKHEKLPIDNYLSENHPLQISIRSILEDVCDINLSNAKVGIDGCAIPTWAIPLRSLAKGFAKLSAPEKNFSSSRAKAIQRITNSVFKHPYMIAGKDRYDTKIMEAFPHQIFVKIGAEGVFCAFLPKLGYGIAVKCDDGAFRGAETILSGILVKLGIFSLQDFKNTNTIDLYNTPVKNRNGDTVGIIRPCF